MNSKERIIKIERGKVFLTKTNSIDFSHTNFHNKYLKFSSRFNIFWKVNVIYDNHRSSITLDVINYNPKDYSKFETQIMKKPVKKIFFKKLNWEYLEPLLISYEPSTLKDIIFNFSQTLKSNLSKNDNIEFENIENKIPFITDLFDPKDTNEVKDKIWSEHFSANIKFTDALFSDGGVYIEKFKTDRGKNINLELFIANSNIKSEFDKVKYYFYKTFKSKTFRLQGKLVFKNDELTSIEGAYSKEIESINNTIIDSVKDFQIAEIPEIKTETNKKLYTFSEIVELLKRENPKSQILINSEKEIIDKLIGSENKSENHRQLMYLSGAMQDEKDKIKFTLHPTFGFLFSFTRKSKKVFCWELIKSHATYLWSIDNNISPEEQSRSVESAINFIIKNGRNKYKRSLKKNTNESDLKFEIITHTQSNSTNNDRFINWKNKFTSILEEVL